MRLLPSPILAAGAALLLFLLGAAGYAGYRLGHAPASPPEVLVQLRQERLRPSDLSYERPTRASTYQSPDSTQTTCATLPASLEALVPADSAVPPSASRPNASRPNASRPNASRPNASRPNPTTGAARLPRARLQASPYLIVPMTGGRPALSVESGSVVQRGYLPATGQGARFAYEIPEPENRLSFAIGAAAFAGGVAARASARYARDVGPLWLSVGAGYRAASTRLRGGYATVGLHKTLQW